jgi:hypothetical protein
MMRSKAEQCVIVTFVRFMSKLLCRDCANSAIRPDAQSVNKLALYPKVMILASGVTFGRNCVGQKTPSLVQVRKDPPLRP